MQLKEKDVEMDGSVEESPMEVSLQLSASEEENSSLKTNAEKPTTGNDEKKEKDDNSHESCSEKGDLDDEKSDEKDETSPDTLSQNDEPLKSSQSDESVKSSLKSQLLQEDETSEKEKKKKILSDSESESDNEKTQNIIKSQESSSSSQENQSQEKKKETLKKKKNTLIDSDSNSEDENRKVNKDIERKRKKQTLNSDSDDSVKDDLVEKKDESDSDNENEKQETSPKKSLSRIQSLYDSDTSTEDEQPKPKSLKEIVSSDEDVFNMGKKKKRKSKHRRMRLFEELEEERDRKSTKSAKKTESVSNSSQKVKKSSKIVDLIDSESDDDRGPTTMTSKVTEFSDLEDITALSGDEQTKKKKSKKSDDKKQSRKSKQAAMQEIQSVTQRLEREKCVSIPYHRPKQRTLEEFLNRKKMSTVVPKASSIAAKLQLYTDIVSKVAQEKEKEAEEFFESEDSFEEEEDKDDEEDEDYNPDSETTEKLELEKDKPETEINKMEIDKDKTEIENKELGLENVEENKNTDTPLTEVTSENSNSITQENSSPTVAPTNLPEVESETPASRENSLTRTDVFKELQSMGNGDDDDEEIRDNIKWTEDEFFILESEKEKPTEEELPKPEPAKEKEKTPVDDSQNISLNLEPDSVPSQQFLVQSRRAARQQLLMSLANSQPRLSGSPGMMIDLSEGENVKSEVDKLIERFTKHNAPMPQKKAKPDTLNKSDEVIILNDENEDPKFKRPGVKMRIFKESLKQQIASQRLEEWKKKEQEEIELKKLGGDEEEKEKDILDLADAEEIEDEAESEPEEEDCIIKEKKRKRNMFEEDEAEVSGEEDEDENEEEEDEENEEDESEEEEEEEKPKKRKRIIRAFEDDDDASNQSEPKTDNEEKLKLKRYDTSADMFNSFENEVYDPPFQQPRNSSDESSQDGVLTKKTTDENGLSKYRTDEALTQEKNFSSFENSPLFFQKSRPTRTSADLNSWLGKQTNLFEKPASSVVTEDELLGICSGKFATDNSQSGVSDCGLSQLADQLKEKTGSNKPTLSGLIDKSQTQCHTDSQLMAICSGEFEAPGETSNTPRVDDETSQDIRLTFEDDSPETSLKKDQNQTENLSPETSLKKDQNSIENLSPKKRDNKTRKLLEVDSSDEEDFGTKPKKKVHKTKALIMSDDEEEENEYSDEESEIEMENEEEERYIDYDSEENEVVVVKNLRKEATKFLENEAELSESDWDSADEDEKGLDRFEVEEGDKEDIDEQEVHDQLGKIHMKQVMDEDQRDVRLLQEILLEEGDLHSDGAGRQRQFKWKNLDKAADNSTIKGLEGVDVDLGDEEDESELIKARIEQQKFLEQTKANEDDDIDLDFNDSQFFQVGLKVAKKSLKTANATDATEEKTVTKKVTSTRESTLIMPSLLSAVLGANSKKANSNQVKGSFLARKDLSRMAKMYKNEQKLVVSKQNFIFNHLSPTVVKEKEKGTIQNETEESTPQTRKRKSGPDDTPTRAKKQKTGVGKGGKKLF